jgi:hypothetical protein
VFDAFGQQYAGVLTHFEVSVFQKKKMFNHCRRRLAFPPGLAAITGTVARSQVALRPDDVFKLAVTIAREDTKLGLASDAAFMTGFAAAAAAAVEKLSPFQVNQVRNALERGGLTLGTTGPVAPAAAALPDVAVSSSTPAPSGAAAATATTSPVIARAAAASNIVSTDPAVQGVVDALRSHHTAFLDRKTFELRPMQEACEELAQALPRITTPAPLVHAVRILAHMNYTDYNLAQRLARRACELATKMSVSEACVVLARLYKLKAQDSMTPLVKRIEADAASMTLADMVHVVQAAHAQSNTTASLHPLAARALHMMHDRTNDVDIRLVVQALEVCARLGTRTGPAATAYVAAAARRAGEMNEWLLGQAMVATHQMQLMDASSFALFLNRAVALGATMDVRAVDGLLDVFSLQPYGAAPFVDAVLKRLADDAGKLQGPQLVAVLEIIAGYPGAPRTPAVAALAFAANVRRDTLDQTALTSVLSSLAQLQQLDDDFHALADFLSQSRRGVKSVEAFLELLGYVSPSTPGAADPRFASWVARCVQELAPQLTAETVEAVEAEMARLGVEDRRARQRLQGRTGAIAAEADERRVAAERSARQMQQMMQRDAESLQQLQAAAARGPVNGRSLPGVAFGEDPRLVRAAGQHGPPHPGGWVGGRAATGPPAGGKPKKKPFDLNKAMWDFD